MGNRQRTQLNVSGFAGRHTACSCSREASCSTVHPQTRSWMRSSWRRPDLAAANSSRASAQEVAMYAELQCGAQRAALYSWQFLRFVRDRRSKRCAISYAPPGQIDGGASQSSIHQCLVVLLLRKGTLHYME